MSSYKLYYFDAPGVAEPIRLLFAYAKVPFEEVRFARGPQWMELKPKMPWNVVPVLEVDGIQLSQSRAILRFLARRFGVIPESLVDQAKCDEYIETMVDLRTEGKNFHRLEDPNEKFTLKEKFITEKWSPFLQKLTKILQGNGNGYLVGGRVTYADIFVAYTVEQITSWVGTTSTFSVEHYPVVKKHMENVMVLPGIKEWNENRSKSQMRK